MLNLVQTLSRAANNGEIKDQVLEVAAANADREFIGSRKLWTPERRKDNYYDNMTCAFLRTALLLHLTIKIRISGTSRPDFIKKNKSKQKNMWTE